MATLAAEKQALLEAKDRADARTVEAKSKAKAKHDALKQRALEQVRTVAEAAKSVEDKATADLAAKLASKEAEWEEATAVAVKHAESRTELQVSSRMSVAVEELELKMTAIQRDANEAIRVKEESEKKPEDDLCKDDLVKKDQAEEMYLKAKSKPKAKPSRRKDGTWRTNEARGPAMHLSWKRGIPSDFIPIGPQP